MNDSLFNYAFEVGLYVNESEAQITAAIRGAGDCTQFLIKSVDTYGGVYNTFTLDPFSVSEGIALSTCGNGPS